jgi:hypothetical protein
MTNEAGFTRKWAVNPENPEQYVILSLTGALIVAPGLTMPKDTYGSDSWDSPRFFGAAGAAADIAVVDWDDPTNLKGYVADTFGGIWSFGTDTPNPPNSMEDMHGGAPFYRGDPAAIFRPDGFEQFSALWMYPKSYAGGAYVGYGWLVGGSGGAGARLYRWGGSHSDYPRGLPSNFLNVRDIYVGPDDDGLYVLYEDGTIWAVGPTGETIGHNITGGLPGQGGWRAFSFNWPRYAIGIKFTGDIHTYTLTNQPATGDNTPPTISASTTWGLSLVEYWENIHFDSFKNPTDVQVLNNFALRQRFQLGAAPTVSSVAVTGTTTTTQPTITWTYSQDRGDHQLSYKVRVYPIAVTQASDFVVGQGSGAAWLSDRKQDVASGDQGSDQVGVNLVDDTTYVAYVMVKSTGEKDSAWSSGTQFLLNVTPPPAPAWGGGSPSTDPDDLPFGTVTLDVTGWQSGRFIQFQVSVGGGAYTDVFGGSRLAGGHLIDYYQQTGVPLRYRARQFFEAPAVIASSWVYSNEVTLAPSTAQVTTPTWRLVDPFDASGTPVAVDLEVADYRAEPEEVAGYFQPISRSGKIKVSAGVKGKTHHLELYSLDRDYFESLTDMLFNGHALMLQSAFGDSWFVAPTTESIQILRAAPLQGETSGTRHAHTLPVSFVEVVRPGATS